MNEDQALRKIIEIFRSALDQPGLNLTSQTVASEVEGWDSISHIDILARIEKEFAVKFTLREIQGFANIGDLVRLVLQKKYAV